VGTLISIINFTRSVAKLGILYNYTVAELNIFMSEVDLNRLACVLESSQSTDNHLVSQSMIRQFSWSYAHWLDSRDS